MNHFTDAGHRKMRFTIRPGYWCLGAIAFPGDKSLSKMTGTVTFSHRDSAIAISWTKHAHVTRPDATFTAPDAPFMPRAD